MDLCANSLNGPAVEVAAPVTEEEEYRQRCRKVEVPRKNVTLPSLKKNFFK